MAQPISEASSSEKLESALAAFDRARGAEEYRASQERVVSLGPEVAPAVIAALSEPQGPERSDLLLTLLHRWVRLDAVLELAGLPESGWALLSSLAEVLPRCAGELHPSETRQRQRIAETLAALASHPHDGVRITAVDAIGAARLAGVAGLRALLEGIAERDPNPTIREEAQEALRASS